MAYFSPTDRGEARVGRDLESAFSEAATGDRASSSGGFDPCSPGPGFFACPRPRRQLLNCRGAGAARIARRRSLRWPIMAIHTRWRTPISPGTRQRSINSSPIRTPSCAATTCSPMAACRQPRIRAEADRLPGSEPLIISARARARRSLMASPSPSSGIGMTAICAEAASSARRCENRFAAASIRSAEAERLSAVRGRRSAPDRTRAAPRRGAPRAH